MVDIMWLEPLLMELRVAMDDKSRIWCNNTSVVDLSTNLIMHSKFKHVELNLFFIHEKVAEG